LKLPAILVRKVPFPGQLLQVDSQSASSNVSLIAVQRPKSVVLIPFEDSEEGDALFSWGVVARVVHTSIRRNGATKLTLRCYVRAKMVRGSGFCFIVFFFFFFLKKTKDWGSEQGATVRCSSRARHERR